MRLVEAPQNPTSQRNVNRARVVARGQISFPEPVSIPAFFEGIPETWAYRLSLPKSWYANPYISVFYLDLKAICQGASALASANSFEQGLNATFS